MKSFSILRTNVGLTSNVKVVVDSNYSLYLESINSIPELDIDRLKKLQFNKDNFYDELVPHFFRNIPVDLAFDIKYDNDNDIMSNNFENQYDDIYQMGARNISNNKDYKEEYEYFAPLYVFKHSIPKYFVVFRVDGPGLEKMDSINFRDLFLEKLKVVKVFDLTKKTELGEWIDRNFTSNKSFPTKSLEVDFRNLEFTRWHGIDYETGGYTYKSRFMDESLEDENTLFDFEKLFYDGYRVNKIIHPQIINFNFLFDDSPATPNRLRKWTLNRYSGFYIDDMELVDKITPFTTPSLKSGFQILSGNIIYHPDGDPFVDGYKDGKGRLVEYLGDFYKVETFEETLPKSMVSQRLNRKVSSEEYSTSKVTKWRIISSLDLTGQESNINTRKFRIDDSFRLLREDLSPFEITDFELSDVHIIQIGDKYHNLVLEDGYIKIFSDYGFTLREEYRFEYFVNDPDPNFYNFIDLKGDPLSFSIFRLNFTQVKDFDNCLIDSDLSRFEYEKSSDLTRTEEPKMYTIDLRSNRIPPPLNDYIYNGKVENIPSSSDYTANLETFRIVNGDLSEMWRKNSINCRWAFQNSLGSSDYPYLLNNNEIHGDYNRCANTKSLRPFRPFRNLDYFYTINSGRTNYAFHSLHVERNFDGVQDISFRFELDKYLNRFELDFLGETFTYSLNYFDYLFDSQVDFLGGLYTKNSTKYSYFDSGDLSIPNTTLFRGLKFKIFEVDSVKISDNKISKINVDSSNLFQDYKFSILLSKNLQGVNDSNELFDIGSWGYFIDNLYNNGFVSFITSTQSSPQNVEIGDMVEIRQSYPFVNSSYNTTAEVIDVGFLGTFSEIGYYGITTNIPWGESTPANPGYYRIMIQWQPIKNWQTDSVFLVGDIVIYDDILFEVTIDNIVTDPSQNPFSLGNGYNYYSSTSPFWIPNYSYTAEEDWIFRDGNYYIRTTAPQSYNGDFWNPTYSYSQGNVVIYKNDFYTSLVNNNSGNYPKRESQSLDISSGSKYWKLNTVFGTRISNPNSPIWRVAPIWNPNLEYSIDTYVVYDEVLYRSLSNTYSGNAPKVSTDWERIYSFVPDTEFSYGTQSNPFLRINDSFYVCTFNRNFDLDNGISIYINKKWKNVLINISINDNTSFDLDNKERDILYNSLNSRLTAANFIRQINSLDSKYGFVDYTSYVVIEENGTFVKYKFGSNIEDLPYIISCEEPDEVELNNNTLKYTSISIDKNILKPFNILKNGEVDNLFKINYYNDIPLGCQIEKNLTREFNQINYNGSIGGVPGGVSNTKKRGSFSVSKPIYRHSGPYMPLFYDIELFDKKICEFEDLFSTKYESETFESIGNIDNTFNIGLGFDAAPFKAVIDVPNEQIIINGDFTTYQGIACSGIIKINMDGSPDLDFISNIGTGLSGGVVRGLCLQNNGKIIVGGQFDNFNGLTFSALVRLNSDGTLDTTFNTNNPMFGSTASVYEVLQQPDGKIICAGSFNSYKGLTVSSGLIRLSQDGDIDVTFDIGSGVPEIGSNAIYSCFLQSDGKIIGGGIFASFDGSSVQNIVRVNSDGTIDSGFLPNLSSSNGVDNIVLGINQQADGKVILGGTFSTFGTYSTPKISRINLDGTIDETFISPFSGSNSIENISFQSNGKIVLGGSKVIETGIIRLNEDGSTDLDLGSSIFSPTSSSRSYLDAVGRILFIGGFTSYDSDTFNRILRLNIEYSITEVTNITQCPKYKFNENLTLFGVIKQRVISKVNRDINLLKLKNLENYKSIYPMIDEFGYTTSDFFIFKSTWDSEYYLECGKMNQSPIGGSLVSSGGVISPAILLPSIDSGDNTTPSVGSGGIETVGPAPVTRTPIPGGGGPGPIGPFEPSTLIPNRD